MKISLSAWEALGSIPGVSNRAKCCQLCRVSSKLCCPGAKPRRRRDCNEDLIVFVNIPNRNNFERLLMYSCFAESLGFDNVVEFIHNKCFPGYNF